MHSVIISYIPRISAFTAGQLRCSTSQCSLDLTNRAPSVAVNLLEILFLFVSMGSCSVVIFWIKIKMSLYEHSSRLLQVSHKLSQQDLKELVFLCQIPKIVAEKIDSGIALFEELGKECLLGPNHYGHLKALLEAIGRKDLAMMLPGPISLLAVPVSQISPFQSFGDTQNVVHDPMTSNSGHSTTIKKRMLLLRHFQDLGQEDLESLAYIFTGKEALSEAEELSKPVRLLLVLEEQGLLNNHHLLQMSLESIRHRDVASKVCENRQCVL